MGMTGTINSGIYARGAAELSHILHLHHARLGSAKSLTRGVRASVTKASTMTRRKIR
jgi:hypothetical protein